jgi:hypothetical protein
VTAHCKEMTNVKIQTGSPKPEETLEHMRKVMNAGVDTFICLQEEVPLQVYTPSPFHPKGPCHALVLSHSSSSPAISCFFHVTTSCVHSLTLIPKP